MKLFRTTLCILIATTFILVCCSCFKLQQPSTSLGRYTYIEELNIYTDNSSNTEKIQEIAALQKTLPDNVQKILTNWDVVVSETPPFECTNIASGATEYNKHVIWIDTMSSTTTFVHEVGHAVDCHAGFASQQADFLSLYEKLWNVGKEFLHTGEVYKHSVSTSKEFFASCFVSYVYSKDTLQQKAPEVAIYFDNLITHMNVWWDKGTFANMWTDVDANTTKTYTKLSQHILDVDNNELININNYSFDANTFWMSDEMEEIAQTIITAAQQPEVYFPGFRNNYVVRLDTQWTKSDYDLLISWVNLYFGGQDLDLIDINVSSKYTDISIKKEVVNAEQNRMTSLAKVEDILSSLREGTDTEKLIQVSQYMYDHYTYYHEANSTFDAFWNEDYCGAATNTMIFKQFADRLGIKNDVVYTMTQYGDVGRIYNRVWIDDQCYYYNLNIGMVHSPNLDVIVFHENDWLMQ